MKEAGYKWNDELKKIEQKSTKWDLADERAASLVRDAISGMKLTDEARYIVLNWLKSLKNKYTWKPSEEQLKSLQKVIDAGYYTSYPNSLETLYEQLKQL